MQKCHELFTSSQQSIETELNCLRLIKNYIKRFDGEHVCEEPMGQYNPQDGLTVQVTYIPERRTESVQVNKAQKLWQLKRKTANIF